MCFSKIKNGLFIILLMIMSSVAMGQVTYKITLDSDKATYRVFIKSTNSYSGSQARIGSAQITVLVPHGTTNKFIVSNIKGKTVLNSNTNLSNEMLWSSTRVDAPNENKNVDYISFGFNNSASPILFDIPANQEIEVLSFKNTGTCLGVVSLFENATDPFKSPNSVNSNPGNSISIAGFGFGNAYSSNFGGSANCLNITPDLNVIPSGNATMTVGSNYSLTLTTTNIGTAATSGMYQIQTTLPAGISYLGNTGSGWSCTSSSQANGTSLVSCQNSSVLNASASSLVVLNLSAAASLTNGSSVMISGNVSGGGESNISNNNYSWNTTVSNNTAPDLNVIALGSATMIVGSNYSLTLTTNNIGTAATSGMYQIQTTLPAGISYLNNTGSGWSCTSSSQANGTSLVNCQNSSVLNASASSSVILNLSAAASLTNGSSVIISGNVTSGGESNTSNNNYSWNTTVINNTAPDLTVSMTGLSSIMAGVQSNYTINISNIGSAATNGQYALSLTLPAGVQYNSFTGNGWNVLATAQSNGTTIISATSSTVINAGGTATPLVLNVTPSNLLGGGNSLNFSGFVTGGGDMTNANNSFALASTVISNPNKPDLKVVVSGAMGIVSGVATNYTFDVQNIGTAISNSVYTLTTTLPAGFTYNSFSGQNWSCSTTTQSGLVKVNCNSNSPIAINGSAGLLSLNITPSGSPQTIHIISSTVSGGGETNTNNNTGSFSSTIGVSGGAYLGINISGSQILNPNTASNFTININNSGTSATVGTYYVSTYLPQGFTYNSSSGNGWTCSPTLQSNGITKVICQSNLSISAGASGVPLVLNLTPIVTNPTNNFLIINSDIVGGGSTNNKTNFFNFYTQIQSLTDLEVSMNVSTKTPTLGQTLTYDIILTNKGPINATNINVLANLPLVLTNLTSIQIFNNVNQTPNYNPNTGYWNVASLGVNQSITLRITGVVAQRGIFFPFVEIMSANVLDIDSIFGNGNVQEDDFARVCFTVPINICAGDSYNVTIPSAYTGIQWYRNGALIQGATSNTYTISQAGNYSFTSNVSCPVGGCCDIIVLQGTVPTINITQPSAVCYSLNLASVPVKVNNVLTQMGLTYYLTEANAQAGTNLLTNTVVFTSGTYWVRYQAFGECATVGSISVNFTKPNLTVQPSFTTCQGVLLSSIPVYNNGTLLNSGLTYYLSETDAQAGSNPITNLSINTAGTYWIRYQTQDGCFNVVSTNVLFQTTRPTKPNVADQMPPCTIKSVSLLSIQPVSTSTVGGVFEWHIANSPTSPLVSNASSVSTGVYYLFEKSTNQCYSEGDAVMVTISDCCKPNLCIPVVISRN